MTDNKWFVYILECEDESLYTGYSPDVKERFKAHCAGKGAKYTKSHKPRRIAHTEQYNTKTEAMRREREIKGLPRKEKLKLIESKTSRRRSSVG